MYQEGQPLTPDVRIVRQDSKNRRNLQNEALRRLRPVSQFCTIINDENYH
jgi:hypothetical protein